MLYNLLFPFSDRIALFNVLRYPSFRIIAAGLTSLVICLLAGPRYIAAVRERQDGLRRHRRRGRLPQDHEEELQGPPRPQEAPLAGRDLPRRDARRLRRLE